MNHLRYTIPLVVVVALLAACTGPAENVRSEGLAALEGDWVAQPSDSWQTLLDGNAEAARAAAEEKASSSRKPWDHFLLGEAAYLAGHFQQALEAHMDAIRANPGSPLAQWSWLRLTTLDGLAAGYEDAVAELLEEVGGTTSDTATAWRKNDVALSVASTTWLHSDARTPFDGSDHGVPTSWRMVGPTATAGNLHIGEKTAPEGDDQLADVYDLLGFERRTQHLTSRSAIMSPDIPLSGVYVAETWVKLDKPATVDVAGFFQGIAHVFIDGEHVLTRDDRDVFVPLYTRARSVELSAGVHRIVVRLGLRRDYKTDFGLMLLPARPTPLTFSATRPEGAAGEVEKAGEQIAWIGDRQTLPNVATWNNPIALYLAAWMTTELAEEELADAALTALDERWPKFSGTPVLEARLATRLWSHPGAVRERMRVAALRDAVERDPTAGLARLKLADALRDQGLREAAAESIAEIIEASPDQVATWREAGRYYRWRGFEAKAEDALERAVELDPSSCSLALDLYTLYQRRNFAIPEDQLRPQWKGCDLLRWRIARDIEVPQGDPSALLALVERDVLRYPDKLWAWKARAETVAEHESVDKALAILDEADKNLPDEPALALTRSELLMQAGRTDDAKKALYDVLEAHPGNRTIHERLALLDGSLPLADLRADGIAAIKRYEANPATFPSAALYVLDYMARRYFTDGSSADVTHLVIKVLAKEGIDDHGEVSFPRNSIPLLVRTVKADGTIVEPDPTPGKPTISMPSLEVGDYIEYAYLTFNGRISTQKGAVIGANFYFKMANIASAHSEFVVEVPQSWDPEFVSRNDPPSEEVSETGRFRRYRFLRTGSAQPRPEPNRVENQEHLPHVQMIHRYGWDRAHENLRNLLAGALARSVSLEQKAAELTDGLTTEEEKARALFDFVVEHVRSRSYGDFSSPAAHVLASGEGNPVVLLRGLLRCVGIDGSIHRVKTVSRDPVETAIPALHEYAFTALKVDLEAKTLWLNPAGPNSPYDYLPRSAQKRPAICIEADCGVDRTETPQWPAELERRDVVFDLALDRSGNLTGSSTETLRGGRAMSRRNTYDDLASDEKIRKYVERTVNYDFSGGELVDYEIKNREDPEKPLVLTYRFRRAGYARPSSDGLVIEDRYDLPDLTRRYARLATRTVPMILPYNIDEQITVKLVVPEGLALDGPGGDDAIEYGSEFGNYSRSVTRDTRRLQIVHRLAVAQQRIGTRSYRDFASWAGDVDRATYGRVVVRPESASANTR